MLGWANVSIAPGGGGGQADWAVCRCMEIRLAGDWRAEKDGRGVMRNLERCCEAQARVRQGKARKGKERQGWRKVKGLKA